MPVAALDGQGNADGDAPGEADSDGVGYLSYAESASDTEEPAANHRDENDPLGQAPMNVALLPSQKMRRHHYRTKRRRKNNSPPHTSSTSYTG